jgi:flagellar basal-body rod protein FlgC
MISSVNSTISALQANRTRLGVTANNIANVNTDEYKKSTVIQKEGVQGDVKVEINRVNSPGYRYKALEGNQLVEKESSNVSLEEELPEMMVTQRTYEANLKVLQTHDRMLGNLLDTLG